MHALQEKFQITVPAAPAPDEPWISADVVRQSQAKTPHFNNERADDVGLPRLNQMPPGMDIDDQCSFEIHSMPLVMSGSSDVSKDTNPQSFNRGFTKREMKGSDDQYTGEHVDHFYGDAGGFCERNNYLDRE